MARSSALRGSTASQRVEVWRLRAEGVSVRKIAEEVFGDRRYRGRVERILARPLEDTRVRAASGEEYDGVDLATVEAVRVLLGQTLRAWLAEGVAPSLSQLKTALEIEQRLETIALIKRLRPGRDEDVA